jgi:hypothetical protein
MLLRLGSKTTPNLYVDGTPPEYDSIPHALSMMNEFLWLDDDNDSEPQPHRNNVTMDHEYATILRANRHIKPAEELFMAYPPDYDWDGFKFDHIANITETITTIWNLYEEGGVHIPPHWRSALQDISNILPLLSSHKKQQCHPSGSSSQASQPPF